MPEKNFFDESTEQSRVKAEIVVKYFWAWANVVIPSTKTRSNRIAYVDLLAGPGRYNDGKKSTPLRVLERAIEDKNLRQMLLSVFNDVDSNSTRSLEAAINELPNLASLKHRPKVYNQEVGDNIVKQFEQGHLVPTLCFVDPWGYKGLSLRLINSVIKDWGCDCIFFFNYNRINPGFHNSAVKKHIDALFGQARADQLRPQLTGMSPDEREANIIESLQEALREMGGEYVLPFRFKNATGTRTSHHLVLVTKHVKGYEIMKEIMAKASSAAPQGVPTFEFNPAEPPQLDLEFSRPLDELEKALLREFAGKKTTMIDVYDKHHVGKRYIKSNYKNALANLESQGKIKVEPPANKRKKMEGKVTFGPTVRIVFPAKKIG